MLDIVKKFDEAYSKKKPLAYVRPLAFLDTNPQAHRRVFPDMHDAFAKMALFFPSATECLEPDLQDELKNYGIVDQVERAKNIPDRRRHNSTKTMPQEFWNEWKAVDRKGNLDENFPEDWDKAIRPIIAHRKWTSPHGKPAKNTNRSVVQFIEKASSAAAMRHQWQAKLSLPRSTVATMTSTLTSTT